MDNKSLSKTLTEPYREAFTYLASFKKNKKNDLRKTEYCMSYGWINKITMEMYKDKIILWKQQKTKHNTSSHFTIFFNI